MPKKQLWRQLQVKMFDEYELFLYGLNKNLKKFFEAQKEYICCKEGCSLCCKTGVYPASEIEFKYIKSALDNLEEGLKSRIYEKIAALKEQKAKENGDKNWTYECPFLIDNKCAVYNNRLIICRTFGLPWFDENDKLKVPSCMYYGLNYSKVYDEKTGQLSDEKFSEGGYKTEPLAYNLSLKFLMNSKLAQITKVDFGGENALIDWF